MKCVIKILKRPRRVNKTMAEMIHKHTGIVVAIGSGIPVECNYWA